MSKLKPCPFCGGKAEEVHATANKLFNPTAYYYIKCKSCGSLGKPELVPKHAAAAWNRRAGAVPVVRGKWIYKVKDNGNCSYSVTAKCSECGWDWFSKDGVGNYSAVFGAFITNGKSRPDEAEMFLRENAKANNKMRFCPNCGADMRRESEGEA